MREGFDHLLDGIVLLLNLTISLRVVSAAKQNSRTQYTSQHLPKSSSETHIVVMYDIPWYTKEPNAVLKE